MDTPVGILIGGESRRMGRPKALLEFGGSTLLERTVGVASKITNRVVLLGRPGFALPNGLAELPIIEDIHRGIGPIGGLESLLAAHEGRSCLLLACDMPHLSGDLLLRLAAAPLVECDAAVCRTGGGDAGWHPCCARYDPRILAVLREAILERQYGMMRLLNRLRVFAVDLHGEEARWVANWNSPEDMYRC